MSVCLSVCLRSQPLFTLDSDETSHEDDGKWNSEGKVSERNTTPDIRLADNDAQIWRDRALRESQAAMTSTPHQATEDQVITNEEDDSDEKFNLERPATGGNVNYLRYSMCKST
jgi:hypothetical protein